MRPGPRQHKEADLLDRRLSLPLPEAEREAASARIELARSAPMVNRTHRVIRERARRIQARRSFTRSLWLPLTVCSGLLVLLCGAVWSVLEQYDLEPNGVPDPSQQMILLLMWLLPLSAIVLAVVWFRRRERSGNETGS